jgi:hypothetical protein
MVSSSWLPRRSCRIHRLAICVLGAFTAFAACNSDRTPELLGSWQANLLIEEGDTIDVILDDVGLYFAKDGSYIYTSTLDYEESGTFRTSGEMLFTTPAAQDTLVERPVEIALLDKDVLHLNMKEGDKNRILEFERIDLSSLDDGDVHAHDHNHDHDGHSHDDEFYDEDFDEAVDTMGIDN